MKIVNSVVVVGLYYGFLTTFSIGPSYLFLIRARVMEEGTEKEVSATTGFIMGQLMMFISIYYAPFHIALGRPHTINVLVLPYLLFHFFWNNQKNVFDYGSTTRNSIHNLSIQCFCWLVNWSHFIHEMAIRSNKYLVLELRNYMARIFRRMPSPIVTKKLKEENAETEEMWESEGEIDVEIETISETKGTKQEEGSIEEDPSPSLCSEENSKLEILKLKEDKDLLCLDQQDGTILEETAEDHEIRSRKVNHVVIFTDTERTNSTTTTNNEV
ncbi:uncharacterized protein LOC113291494 [Papaver somniferum]|uniref:uncharacterized protein LOC113291494 n=1 Tax=Papaver somniferum TaxID=3469 RepID=UPI000E7050CD|nr:uncharacterized protein LOC113291494 [Papaver somniferum]